jgi:hypothetical protein
VVRARDSSPKSVRQGGFAGVGPGGEPVGADVGGGTRELVDQGGSGLIVEAVEIFVVVGFGAETRVAVGEKDDLDPSVSAEAGLEGVIGGIADEGGVIGTHGEERSEAIDERGAETVVDSGLQREMAVEIFGGVEGIVSFRDVRGEDRGVEAGFVPFAEFEGIGELRAVDADLPGKQPGCFQLGFAVFADGGFVVAGELRERKAAVPVEIDEVIVFLGGLFQRFFKWISDVLN